MALLPFVVVAAAFNSLVVMSVADYVTESSANEPLRDPDDRATSVGLTAGM